MKIVQEQRFLCRPSTASNSTRSKRRSLFLTLFCRSVSTSARRPSPTRPPTMRDLRFETQTVQGNTSTVSRASSALVLLPLSARRKSFSRDSVSAARVRNSSSMSAFLVEQPIFSRPGLPELPNGSQLRVCGQQVQMQAWILGENDRWNRPVHPSVHFSFS